MRVFWPLYLLQMLLLLSASFTIGTNLFSVDRYAEALFLLHQGLRAGREYWADVLSHSAYLELNVEFPTKQYSNNPVERWDVPTWFTDPKGGTEVYCTGIGCTIWNLTDAGSSSYATNPCPDVIPYLPAPSPLYRLQALSVDGVRYYASLDANEAARRLTQALSASVGGVANIIPLSVEGASTDAGKEINGEAEIRVAIPLDVLLEKRTRLRYEMDINAEYIVGEARCICRNVNTGTDETLATYDVNRALFVFYIRNPETNHVPTHRSMVYVQWFVKRTFAPSVSPSDYEECRMVLP